MSIPMEAIRDQLLTNYSNIVDPGTIQQYFTGVSDKLTGFAIKDLHTNIIDINDKSCKGSLCIDDICFPDPIIADVVLRSDNKSNELFVSSICDSLPGFQRIIDVYSNDGKFSVRYDVHPIGLADPRRIGKTILVEDVNRPSHKPLKSSTLVLNTELLIDIITTVINTLTSAYMSNDYNHGNLTHESIGFRDGKAVICNLSHSSLIIKSSNKIVKLEPDVKSIRKLLRGLRGSFIPESDHGFYHIDSTNRDMNGMSSYRSIDYYTFIMSILSIGYIFDIIMSDYVLKSAIFDSIFNTADISYVYEHLLQATQSSKVMKYSDIITILNKCTLRCNAMDLTMERLNRFRPLITNKQ